MEHRGLKSQFFTPISVSFSSVQFVFLKRESRRTIAESKHMDYLMEKNDGFFKLEIIKEKMGLFFDASNADEAFQELAEIRNWCHQLEFGHLLKWHRNIMEGVGHR